MGSLVIGKRDAHGDHVRDDFVLRPRNPHLAGDLKGARVDRGSSFLGSFIVPHNRERATLALVVVGFGGAFPFAHHETFAS